MIKVVIAYNRQGSMVICRFVLFIAFLSLAGVLTVKSQEKKNADIIQKRIENQYQGFITKADFEFSNSNFEVAKGNYQMALEMNPSQKYPLKQIKKIDSLLLVNKAFESSVKRADYFFKTKKYEEAKNFYANAIKLKGRDKYVEKQIDYIDSVFQVKDELVYLEKLEDFHFKTKELSAEEQYQKYIKEADDAFNKKAYNKAGRLYEWALLIIPDKEYAQNQLDKIYTIFENENEAREKLAAKEKQLQDSLRRAKKERFYKAIENANTSITKKQFELAITFYNEAATIWPEKKGDVEQLVEFVKNSIANREKNQKLYDRIINDADREFLSQEYRTALGLYQRANQLIPDNPYPLIQIQQSDSLIKNVEEPFLALVEEAEIFEDQNLYEEAIKKYKEAHKLKPNSKLLVSRISDVESKHDNIQKNKVVTEQNHADYLEIIKKADLAFKNNDYKNAALNYKLASNLKPFENYPKERLSELNEIQANKRNEFRTNRTNKAQQQYEEAIRIADTNFKAGKYTEAKVYYKRAFLYKPDEVYPYNQLKAIDDLYSQSIRKDIQQKAEKSTVRQVVSEEIKSGLSKSEKEELLKFQCLVKQADDAFAEENYSVARVYYKRALVINPKEEFLVSQLDKIEELIRVRKDEQSGFQYKDNINKANDAFRKGEFSVARFFYQTALSFSPNEAYPKKQLDAIRKIEEDIQREETERKYFGIIEKADNAYYDENFPVARYQYNKALEIKPEDEYANERLANIDRFLKLQHDDQVNKEYLDELRVADDAFYLGNFAKASFYYQKAKKLKPAEEYPIQQIQKITELTQ